MKFYKLGLLFLIIYILYFAFYFWLASCNSVAECNLFLAINPPPPFFPTSLIFSPIPFSENIIGLLLPFGAVALLVNSAFYYFLGFWVERLIRKSAL